MLQDPDLTTKPVVEQMRQMALNRPALNIFPRHSTKERNNNEESKENEGYRPEDAIAHFGKKLTPYEQTEIFQYKKVYFVGSHANKIGGVVGAPNNDFYDDENGLYKLIAHDHIAFRYEVLKMIGKGSFGEVIMVLDRKYKQYVALKVLVNRENRHRMGEEEIMILDHIRRQDPNDHHNAIRMLEAFNFRNHKCITFELLWKSLFEVMKRNNSQGFSLQLVRKFAYSIVKCLDFLHANFLIHGDLKPENLMLKGEGMNEIKVIDFGLSCYANGRQHRVIQTISYRAPEVLLELPYGMAVDMWSLGCTLAELLTGQVLMRGEDSNDQMDLIIELLGMPPNNVMERVARMKTAGKGYPTYCTIVTNPDGSVFLSGGPPKRGIGSRSLNQALENPIHEYDELFLDFLRRCLVWDPHPRMTPQQALNHQWLRPETPSTRRDVLAGWEGNQAPPATSSLEPNPVPLLSQSRNDLRFPPLPPPLPPRPLFHSVLKYL